MCVRFCPLTAEEAQAALEVRGTGCHGIRFIERPDPLHDARSGSTVPLFVPDGAGGLRVAQLEWGFPLDGNPNAVFNTRIESALKQPRRGRRGMGPRPSQRAAASYPRASFTRDTPPRRLSARRPASPSAASTASAYPVPARPCSLASSRTAASQSSPRGSTPASPQSTTACRSCSGPASRLFG